MLSIPIVGSHAKYFGLTTLVGRDKTRAFNALKVNLCLKRKKKRNQGWKEKLLSKAGEEISY